MNRLPHRAKKALQFLAGPPSSESQDSETLDAEFAVAQGFLTQDEFHACRAEHDQRKQKGEKISLGQILCEKGYLTEPQLEQVRQQGRPTSQVCPQCQRFYNVAGQTPGIRLRCLQCGHELRSTEQVPASTVPFSGPGSLATGNQLQTGKRLAKYVLVREVGAGGMGTVYEAQDLELQRRVALKILQEGLVRTRLIQRLHREASLAAQLDHPNIVGIHEVGMIPDESGRTIHYIAMDFIEGKTLDGLIHDRATQRARLLALLEEVAHAVTYAHGKGVIHRDIKPGNVLVDTQGRAILTDFGLARAESTQEKLTASQAVMGTPQYMAPEQVRGRRDEIGKHTDIYALGVMLYEILTGHTPFSGTTNAAMFQKILHEEPLPPSRRRRSVERDLEIICLKALEKDPSRRYGSAAQFTEDLRRFRSGEPILARPPSFLYQWSKRVRKRGALVWTAAATFVLVTLAGLLIQHAAAGRAFEKSRAKATNAYQAKDWATALRESERALGIRPDEGLAQIARESRTRIESEKAELARRAEEAEAYRSLEQKIKPVEELIKQTRTFFYIQGVNVGEKLERVETALEKLQELTKDAGVAKNADVWVTLGIGWYLVGDAREAEEALLKAEALAPEEGWANFYLGKIYLERSLEALLSKGMIGSEDAREAKLRHWSQLALKHLGKPVKGWIGAEEIDRHVAKAYQTMTRRDDEQALRVCDEGLEKFRDAPGSEEFWLLKSVVSKEPDEEIAEITRAIERRPHYPWAYFLRGTFWRLKDDDEQAIQDYDEALRTNPRLLWAYINRGGARHRKGDLDGALSDCDSARRLDSGEWTVYHNRGSVWRDKEDFQRALADYNQAIQLEPRSLATYLVRADLLQDLGDWDGALADYEQILRIDPQHATAYNNRGEAWRERGDFDRALADLDQAIALDPRLSDAHANRGIVWYDKGDLDRAIANYDQAIQLSPKQGRFYSNRGLARLDRGDLSAAEADFAEAVRLDPEFPDTYANRGKLRYLQGDLDGALADSKEFIRLKPRSPLGYYNRGRVWHAKGDVKAALADTEEALRVDPTYADAWFGRALLRYEANDTKGAIGDYTEAIRLNPRFVDAYKNRGSAHLLGGNLDEALADFDQALHLKANRWDILYNRSVVWFRRGNYTAAQADCDEVIRADPGYFDAYLVRGHARAGLGQWGKAVLDFQKALDLAPPDWNLRSETQQHLERARGQLGTTGGK